MKFEISLTRDAEQQLSTLEKDKSQKTFYKSVAKTLGLMQVNLRHPSLHTHEYTSLSREFGCKIFESYAQNNTPGAYRVFWFYGPAKNEITIVAIVHHP